jgi:hypothetical protein
MTRKNRKEKISFSDPFPTPQTIPAQWDLTGLGSVADGSSKDWRLSSADEQNPQPAKNPGPDRKPEPFPKTRTMPEDWDLGSWLDEF